MMGYKILVYWQITEEQKQKIREIADKHGCTTCFVTNLEERKQKLQMRISCLDRIRNPCIKQKI